MSDVVHPTKAELSKVFFAEHKSVSNTSGVTARGVIQHFSCWENGKLKTIPHIHRRTKNANGNAPPYTMVFSLESATENANAVKLVRDADGKVVSYSFRAAVTGVTRTKKDTNDIERVVDKRTGIVVEELGVHYWHILHDADKTQAERDAVPERIRRVIETYMDPSEPKFLSHVWKTVSPNTDIECKFFAYEPDKQKKMMRQENGQYLMRQDASIVLRGANPQVQISVYKDKNATTEATPDNPFAGILFGRTTLSFMPYDFTIEKTDKPLFEVLDERVDRQQRFFAPWGAVSTGVASIPRNMVIYTDDYGTPDDPNCKVQNMVLPHWDRNNYLWEPKDDPEGVTQKYVYKLGVFYPDIQERYSVEIMCQASKDRPDQNPVDAIGIFNNEAYTSILMACQPLPAYVTCSVSTNLSARYPFNQQTEEQRNANPHHVKGYYKAYANRVVPHWSTIRDRYMFPVSKELFISLLSDAAKQTEDRDQRKFKQVTEDDETVYYLFDTFRTRVNPLHRRGKESPVINFGNAQAPAFHTTDLGNLLDNVQLYAWTSFDFQQATGVNQPDTSKQGDALLTKLIGGDIQYQIFGFQGAAAEASDHTSFSSEDLDDEDDSDEELDDPMSIEEQDEEDEEEDEEPEPEPEVAKEKPAPKKKKRSKVGSKKRVGKTPAKKKTKSKK